MFPLVFSGGGYSPWGQNTLVLSPHFALCNLDLAALSAPWDCGEVTLCSWKREVLWTARLAGRGHRGSGCCEIGNRLLEGERQSEDENTYAQPCLSQGFLLLSGRTRKRHKGVILIFTPALCRQEKKKKIEPTKYKSIHRRLCH